MNNPFDYTPDKACDEAFRQLVAEIDKLKSSCRPSDVRIYREFESGKMLGVLVAEDKNGERHILYAFSGQLGEAGFHYPGFVGPVFDYLAPDGYFRTREDYISRCSRKISVYERELTEIRGEYAEAERRCNAQIAEYKEKCILSKRARDIRRSTGNISEEENIRMIRESQFEKAELRRIKRRMRENLAPFKIRLSSAENQFNEMKRLRHVDSENLQDWLFSNFKVLNALGESRSLRDIFAFTNIGVPPSGTGECCAPKLLQAAYLRGLRPVSIAEYWYGLPKGGEVRIHGQHYPACRGKCLPVLRWMLKGLNVEPPLGCEYNSDREFHPEIVFENEWFCVVNKPSGMLSVPGRIHSISLQEWLEDRYGRERQVKPVHRLDQDTSGLIVATFGERPFKEMQALFARRQIHKTYIAELEGDYLELGLDESGVISLPLSSDWLDRPRQRIDRESGKEAVTEYKFIGVGQGRSRVVFHPHTGRTHQLRVHAASREGLGMAIIGDTIYGKNARAGKGISDDRGIDYNVPDIRKKSDIERILFLHAFRLEFIFPLDGRRYSFEAPLPF